MNDIAQATQELSTRAIAEHVDGDLEGSDQLVITSMEAVDRARAHQLTLISSERYSRQWEQSEARAALVARQVDLEPGEARALIRVDDVDLAVAKVLDLLAPPRTDLEPGVSPAAVVDASATVDPTARIGPNCYIGRNAHVGAESRIHPNVVILENASVGAGCTLWPGVVISERCRVGDGCILHPNVTIGADGFGYRPSPDGEGVIKIPQIGTVEIGPQVEIGAGSCVDRAKFGVTEIGAMTKIDNLVQVGHNCRVGKAVLIAGSAGLAGSVTVGDGAVIGGGALVRDHVTVGAGARIAGFSGVMNDVPEGATWGGYPAQDAKIALREQAAIRKLPDALRHMRKQR